MQYIDTETLDFKNCDTNYVLEEILKKPSVYTICWWLLLQQAVLEYWNVNWNIIWRPKVVKWSDSANEINKIKMLIWRHVSIYYAKLSLNGQNPANKYILKVNNNTKKGVKYVQVNNKDSKTRSIMSFWCLYC